MGNPWTKQEINILNSLIAQHGVSEGSRRAAMQLPRTASSCVGQFYYQSKEKMSVRTQFQKFEYKNGEAYAVFKIVG
jgi:hypothetical protein